jgi:radical SAM-linked protein
MSRQRLRIRFSKEGDLRMISHRDLLRTLERLFRRARLKLAMTQGFHARPRMMFPSALSVGIAADDEVMELELDQTYEAEEVLQRLRQAAVVGLEFRSVQVLNPDERKGQVKSVVYEFPVPAQRSDDVLQRIEQFLAQSEWPVNRPRRELPVDIRRDVLRLELNDDALRMTLAMSRDASVRPRDVLEVLGLSDLEFEGRHLTRTAVRLVSQ